MLQVSKTMFLCTVTRLVIPKRARRSDSLAEEQPQKPMNSFPKYSYNKIGVCSSFHVAFQGSKTWKNIDSVWDLNQNICFTCSTRDRDVSLKRLQTCPRNVEIVLVVSDPVSVYLFDCSELALKVKAIIITKCSQWYCKVRCAIALLFFK